MLNSSQIIGFIMLLEKMNRPSLLYPHRNLGGVRMKISVFPSSCVRYKGSLVAFELVHANGMLNHLYVMPEHRGKKLGLIVEQDMARRLIKYPSKN